VNKTTVATVTSDASKAPSVPTLPEVQAAANATTPTCMIPRICQEFKNLIPPLSTEEREQLEQNILARRKCHDPIVLWDGKIIDGHNRFEICVRHGIEFEIVEADLPSKDAAMLWILENQLGRRNLNEAMRIELTMTKAAILQAKARKKMSEGGKKGRPGGKGLAKMTSPSEKGLAKMTSSHDDNVSLAEMALPKDGINVRKAHADDAGVSERTLHNYLQLKAQAHPELLALVQSGKIKIGTAHRMLGKEIHKQLTQVDKMYKFILKHLPPQGIKAANPEIHANLETLYDTLKGLTATLDARYSDGVSVIGAGAEDVQSEAKGGETA